jgi:hypothetical protein
MIRKILRRLTTQAVLGSLISLSVGSSAANGTPGQSDAMGPGGTPLACNFAFRLKGGSDSRPGVDSLDASTDCDTYHIYLANHPTDRARSTFTISETGSTGSWTYHLADMPLDEVVLLLKPGRQSTRVLARRGNERINFIVGRTPFTGPQPGALSPRYSSGGPAAVASQASSPAGTPPAASKNALVGSWRAVGVILELRADGTFSRVSHSSFGSFGGVIGLDDNGSFEVRGDQIAFHGTIREQTCAFSLTSRNELVLCDSNYHRE